MRWLLIPGLATALLAAGSGATTDVVPVAFIAAACGGLVTILSGKIVVPTGWLRAAEKRAAENAERADKWEGAYMALNELVRTRMTEMAVESAGALAESSKALGAASLALHDAGKKR